MKSKSVPDQQDPFGGAFNPAWNDPAFQNFLPPAGSPPAVTPIPPTPALTNQAIVAEAAQVGATTTVVVTDGGITFDLIFDAAASAAPSFMAGVEQAATILAATITDKITVNLKIDYSGTGGGASAGPDGGQLVPYSTVRADLIAKAAPGDPAFNLPIGPTIQGQSSVAVWNAELKLFGLLPANSTTTDDGSATFATDIPSNLLVGVALHELTHALGRIPYGPQPDIFDLYRFTSAGNWLFTNNIPASAAYFSLDGGITKIADYGKTSDPSDFLNSGVQGPNDPYNEFYTNSTSQTLSAVDKEQLDVLGFSLVTQTSQSIVVAATASEAVQAGAAVTLLSGAPVITDSASTTLSSATIKIASSGGSAVAGDKLYVNGIQNGSLGNGVTASWNAGTDTLTLTGSASLAVYDTLLSEVTYQDTGADSSTGSHPARTVTWSVNDGTAGFNTTSQITIDRAPVATVANVVLGANAVAASSLLTASDADGDAIATYAFMDTGNGHFVLNGVVQANNKEIDVTAAQLSQLTYQSTGGVDSLQVRVNDGTTWSAWQGFTVTGPVTKVIESYGSTSLVEVGSNYYLDSISTGTGPELKFGGAAVSAGQYSPWTPVGVEQTATGYEVVWQTPGTQQFSIWNTDSSGNETSYSTLSGTSTALETLETSFKQDLNGDGVIGVPGGPVTKVIESFGSTSLVEVGSNYYLDSISTGTGPELKFGGAAVSAGQYSPWTPVGVEQTATGYEVAWQIPGTQQFSIWNTDSSGNETSYSTLSGTSTALETLETSFKQDLNGDGVIGVPGGPVTKVIESFGSTSLVEVGSNYYLDSISTGTGPELKFGGAAVSAGQYSPWTPVGVEQTATGYEVAWQIPGTQQFSIWNTDSSGNETSYSTLSGTSTALETLETSFKQDLNGDGVIGVPSATAPLAASVSIGGPGNDGFVFARGPAANVAGNAGNASSIELESAVAHSNQLAAFLQEAQPGQSQFLFQVADGSHDTVGIPGNHDSPIPTNSYLSGLHASGFMIH
jgi:hypothetical protein